MKLYGIRNCGTVKKARKWLDEQGISYEFHDFKKDGLDEVRDTISAHSAHAIMLENTSIIKRPVVEHENSVYVGFNANDWATLIN